jgi:polysaccharide biosynthesis/export protein
MLHPSVTISVLQYASAGVTILGEVKRAGVYTLLGPHSLYDALAAAGGMTPIAGLDIKISHMDNADSPLIVPLHGPDYSAEIRKVIVLPGDTVVVSQADIVYVVGDVARSGSFPLPNHRPLTIMELMGLAGGMNRTAAVSRAAIVRPTPNGGAQRVQINLDKILSSQEKDIALQPGDVLVVPRSGFKTFALTALPPILNGVVNVGVAEILVH